MNKMVDKSIHQMSEELRDSQLSMHAAIEAAGIYYFEYYPKEHYALQYHGKDEFGLDAKEENYPACWFERGVTHPEDEALLREAFDKVDAGDKNVSCTVRNRLDDEYRYFSYHFTSIYNEKGERKKVVCTAQDITESYTAQELSDTYQRLYTRTPGWVFTCKNDEKWTMLQSNNNIYKCTGYTKEDLKAEKDNSIASLIPEKYRNMIKTKITKMQQKGYGSSAYYDTQTIHRDGSIVWMQVSLYWDEYDSEGILYCTCTDITKLKMHEQELIANDTMYRLTTENANISLWKYDITADTLYNTEYSTKLHHGEAVIPNFVQMMLSSDMLRADSRADFSAMYESLRQGCESVTADIWYQRNDGIGWWCERVTYAATKDENGQPDIAFAIGRDVTEFKLIEERITEEESTRSDIGNENLLLRTRANLTHDTVDELNIGGDIIDHGEVVSFSQGVLNLIENSYTNRDADLVKSMFAKSKIAKAALENEHYSFEYRRMDLKGHAKWVRVIIRAYVNPSSGDTIVFVYMYDINTEKNLNAIINRVADCDYEVLALLYTESDDIEEIRSAYTKDYLGIDYDQKYHQGISEFIDKYMIEADKEVARKAFSIANLKEKLKRNEVYEISFGLDGQERYQKKWEFTYLDDTRKTIIYSRTDVTDLFREQEEQKEALRNALIQAEEASKAKTNFLSRMSHEIRTPMNAIIGMNTLAIQSSDNPQEVRDCLSKIGISARFLLSLINDILDMSRIESGKVTINKKKFPLDEMVQSINSIFYEQAEKKGLDYDCIIASFVSDYYIGDQMKLQQILVNLLSNAIKFTSAGGKIQLIIRQDRIANGKAYMTFSVNDTGIGISEEFQKKMFEPFEQEDSSTTSPYKGTGLGLAISKNLVNMMGGTILVHSIEGVGTEFIVHVALDLCKEEKIQQKLSLGVSLDKLNTLIVDDDVMICEHTKELLNDVGMKAEWIDSGYGAVELIKKKWERQDYFDVVLLDWKMPDMDGIETAREIRKIVGDDVTIIVMTAYDWVEIEEQAKPAGVNLLVAKPLFKSSIVSVFERAFKDKEKKETQAQKVEYDFTGKRILLVEDHILNVEIAKRLLESKKATVDVAENGLRSIEMYTEVEDGYYDAILMDIRMPIMDGLTATRAIRQLRKPSAKDVPIIAMSANAFDEDVNKSKQVGMNEHLSKPIEAELLYATLQKWL